MLFLGNTPTYFFISTLLLAILIIVMARYAYRINSRRPIGDPLKRDVHLAAIFLAPLTWPLFLVLSLIVFVLRFTLHTLFFLLFIIPLRLYRGFLSFAKVILQFVLSKLKGRGRLKYYFLRTGLRFFIAGNFFQILALFL